MNELRDCPKFDIPLSILFKQSIQTHATCQFWFDVTSLYASGCRLLKGNYKPISLTNHDANLFGDVTHDKSIHLINVNGTMLAKTLISLQM